MDICIYICTRTHVHTVLTKENNGSPVRIFKSKKGRGHTMRAEPRSGRAVYPCRSGHNGCRAQGGHTSSFCGCSPVLFCCHIVLDMKKKRALSRPERYIGLQTGLCFFALSLFELSNILQAGLQLWQSLWQATMVTPITSPMMKETENIRQRKSNKRYRRYRSEHQSPKLASLLLN